MEKLKRIFFVANVDWFFISHRLPLAVHALQQGYEVYLLTANTGRKQELEKLGIHFIDIPFRRSGNNPFHELKCIFQLHKHYRHYRPDIIHHITLKAALLGSLAAKLSGRKHVINAISGLGYNFTDGRNGGLQKIIKLLLRISLRSKSFSFILQNPDDVKMIGQLNLVPSGNIHLIKGSGVDLQEYNYTPPRDKNCLNILFPARILLDKGVMEFIEAAKSVRAKAQGKAKFILAGDCDKENLAVLKEKDLCLLLETDYIEWIGFQKNMLPLYQTSDIVVLPSYREGLPKSLIEACAVGRPIITTDVPGCRECVIPDYNGFLIPAKKTGELAEALLKLIENAELRHQFGLHSRKLAEKEFSINTVIEKTFQIYDTYLS